MSNIKLIPKSEWRTSDLISTTEKTRMISARGEEIARYGISTLTPEEMKGLENEQQIAEREFALRKVPYKIRRIVGVSDGITYIEERDPNEMN